MCMSTTHNSWRIILRNTEYYAIQWKWTCTSKWISQSCTWIVLIKWALNCQSTWTEELQEIAAICDVQCFVLCHIILTSKYGKTWGRSFLDAYNSSNPKFAPVWTTMDQSKMEGMGGLSTSKNQELVAAVDPLNQHRSKWSAYWGICVFHCILKFPLVN